MQTYLVHGLSVGSDVHLDELPPFDASPPDLKVELHQRHLAPIAPLEEMAIEGNIDRFLFSLDGSIFEVLSGREIRIFADKPRYSVRAALLGWGIGLALFQRGRLVLHGSAAQIGQRAVIFCGYSTAGKSTVAAACYHAGHPVVADDVVSIISEATPPSVIPAFGVMKLSRKMAWLLDEGSAFEDVPHGDKRKHWLSNTPQQALSLAAIYIIDSGPPAIAQLKPADGLIDLVRHTYTRSPIRLSGKARKQHFDRCARVAAAVPIRRLYNDKRVESLETIVKLVEDDVASL